MKRPKGSKPADNPEGNKGLAFGQYWFVKYELDVGEKDRVREMIGKQELTGTAIIDRMIDGYKFSANWTDGGTTMLASLTCVNPTHMNAGGVLTGRGKDFKRAIAVLEYKLIQLDLYPSWRDYTETRREDDDKIG